MIHIRFLVQDRFVGILSHDDGKGVPFLPGSFNDGSLSISPELLYTGITNLELRLKGIALVGQNGSDFGEKPSDYRVELRVRYYF